MTESPLVAADDRPRFSATAIVGILIAMLFLAGAIHICTILLVPAVAEVDGWSRLVKHAGQDKFAEIPVGRRTAGPVAGLDPLFVNGVCRLNVGDVPTAITVEARDRFWSLALYDPSGTIIFSLNDRTAVDGHLDMLVVDPTRNAELRQAPAAQTDETIVVEAQSDELIALLRLFAPTDVARADARRILAKAECLPEPLDGTSAASGG